MSSALRRALDRNLRVAVYTEEMFVTSNDDDNRAPSRPWRVISSTSSGSGCTANVALSTNPSKTSPPQ